MKNPFQTMSPRSIRLVYSVAVVAVLAVVLGHAFDVMVFKATSNDQCAWLPRPDGEPGLLIEQVVPGGVADVAGIRNGDILLKIDGKDFKEGGGAMQMLNSIKRNEYAEYFVARGDSTFTARVQVLKVFDIRYFAFFLLGFGFLVVGYIVVMTRPQGRTQRVFARYGIFSMLFLGMSQINLSGEPFWRFYLFGLGITIGWIFALPNFITFFLHFPVRRKILDRAWLRPVLYGYSVLSVLPLLPGVWPAGPPFLRMLLDYTPTFFFAAGLVIFILTYFRRVERPRRRQLRPVLIGVAVGLLTLAYVYVLQTRNPFAMFTRPILLAPMFLIILLPCTFGYSIFRYRLMDIDFIIKRSLLYAMVTGVLAAFYLLLVYIIGNAMAAVLGTEQNEVVSLVAFLAIAFAFDPLKRKAQDWIDRIFYQERFNYQKALSEFSQELPRLMNLDQILASMLQRISSTMHVENVAVVLCDEKEGCSCATLHIDSAACAFGTQPDGLLALLRQTQAPQSFSLLSTEPDIYTLNEEDKQRLLKSGVVLAVPMFLQSRLIGSINVGAKLSGKVYSKEDIDLLSIVASQAAIAIENARLHKSDIEKQKIEEELALARRIQQGLLPKANPLIEGLDIAGVSIPALTVGGDYFDYINLGEDRLLVVVGDVSGKGMSAALYMSKIQGMIQVIAPMYEHPKDMLIQVNRRIYEGIERKSFITMTLALFDLGRKEVLICRAGHSRALIGVNGQLEYLRGGGIGLGLERGPIFESELEEAKRPLARGSVFVFYSDGVTEAMNERNVQFGEETVYDIVSAKRSLSAKELQRTILTSVEEFRGAAEQHDDLTLVVVKSAVA
jgi:sigma-B regulation protein RsbU (phosphoserine phosphatase)